MSEGIDFKDRVHLIGMSEDGSTSLVVDSVYGDDNKKFVVEPPIRVTLEGQSARVALAQDALVARYDDEELRQIGEGSSTLGLKRVIGDIAVRGGLVYGEIKPLHPNLIEGKVIDNRELTTSQRAISV